MRYKHLLTAFLPVLFLFTSDAVLGQRQKLDSLLKEYSKHPKEDSVKLVLLDSIVKYYASVNPKIGLSYSDTEINMANRQPDSRFLGDAYVTRASLLSGSSYYKDAIVYNLKALSIFEKINDNKRLSDSYYWMSNIKFFLFDDSEAIINAKQAYHFSVLAKDSIGMGNTLINIAISYRRINKEESVKYANQGLLLFKSIGDSINLANSLSAIGGLYSKLLKPADALNYYQQALAIYSKFDSPYEVSLQLGMMGSTYYDLGRFKTAIEYLKKSQIIAMKIGAMDMVAVNHLSLSNIYLDTREFHLAIRNSLKAIEIGKKMGTLYNQRFALSQLVDAYDSLGDFKNGYKFYREFILIKDSMSNSDKQKEISQMQNHYDYEKRTDSINVAEKILEENVKEDKKLNILSQQRRWYMAGGGFLLVLSAGLFFFYMARLKQIRLTSELALQKNEQQIKEAVFRQKLGDITLSALRSQMNPHFIFNCLNSIKLYAAQNDAMAASDYLTKFSRLIRQMLENSRSDRISLKSEMVSLELYIQMEAMRFKEKLKYQITVDQVIDTEYFEIPPLLIQPYVENAIWHGLMQKEEGGLILVHISKNEREDMLTATITDNGIGRQKASEIKSKSATKHKSYGMKVTSERIALINQVYKSNTTVEVTDLFHESGEPAGTKVVIQIPV